MFRFFYYLILSLVLVAVTYLLAAHEVPDPDLGAPPENDGKPRCETIKCEVKK